MRLRHCCIESDEPSRRVIYRKQINVMQGNNNITTPVWFKHLLADVLYFASPVCDFGLYWVAQDCEDGNQIAVGMSKAGLYNVMVTAKGNNICATIMCPRRLNIFLMRSCRQNHLFL